MTKETRRQSRQELVFPKQEASRRSFLTSAISTVPVCAILGSFEGLAGCTIEKRFVVPASTKLPSAGTISVIADGLHDPEGPIALADGSVLLVEIQGKTLTRVRPNGAVERIAELEGGPNGAALGPDGLVYICNSGGWIYRKVQDAKGRVFNTTNGQAPRFGWIEQVDLTTGQTKTLYTQYDGVPLQSPNDLVFDATGHFYFTDYGKRNSATFTLGSVYRAAPDGSRIVKIIDTMFTPNGIGLSPDGRTLYVAETITRRLWAFNLETPERIVRESWPSSNGGRLIASLPDYNSLDSLAVDQNGWVNVASLVNGGIWAVAPDGSSRHHVAIDDPFTSNLCFGGDDLKTVFVTMSGSGCLGRLRWPVAGLPLHFSELAPPSRSS
jgi:gluconolactonase